MTIRYLCLLVLLCGCSGAVEGGSSEEPAPLRTTCPVVECAFDHGTCDPATMTYRETREDVGPGCWMKTASCFPKSTPVGCEPADCYFEQGLGCESH